MNIFKKSGRESKSLVMTLASYLFFFSSSALFLVSSVQFYSYITSQQEIISKNQKIIATDAANSVSDFIEDKISILETTFWVNNPVDQPVEEQKKILKSLLGLQPSIREIAIADDKNTIISSASKRSDLYQNKNIDENINYAFEKTRQKEQYISPVYVDDITNEPLLLIAVPIRTVLGEFQGSVYAEINLKFMWELVDQISFGKSGYVYVVDNNGRLIAFGDAARVLKNENISVIEPVSKFINKNKREKSGEVGVFTGINNKLVVGTYVSLSTPEWAVITELPVYEAYQKVIYQVIISIIILLIAAVSIGLSGYLIAKKLAVPMIELMNTATRISEGDKHLKANVKGPREVEALANAFNSMTSQLNNSLDELEEKYIEIKKAQKDLEKAQYSIDKANDAIFWINKDARFTYVNDMACKLLGYSKEELLKLHIEDVVTEFSMEYWLKEWEKYNKNIEKQGKPERTYHKRKDGTIFPIEVSSSHIWFDDTELHVAYVRDITEKEKAEEAIRQKTEELDKYFSSNLDLLCIADVDGYFRRLNAEWENTLGYPVDELINKRFLDYVHPDDYDDTIKAMQKLSNSESILNFTNRYRCKDGTYKWIEWRSYPSGKQIYASARDITDRIRFEEQLKISRHAIDKSMDAVFLINKDGGFSFVNEKAYRSLGYEKDELSKMKLWDIDDSFTEEIWTELWRGFQSSEENIYQSVSSYHTHKDGTKIPVEINASHIWFGEKEFHLASVRDISERKSIEEKLNMSQFSIDQSMDAVFWINQDAKFTYVNTQACKSLGYSREELINKSLWEIDHRFSQKKWYEDWQYYHDNKKSGTQRHITFHKRKDGHEFPVEVHSKHIWFGDTEFRLANVRDITERVKAESELRAKEAQLTLALKTANLGHWEYDIETDTFIFNDLFYSLFKTDVNEVGSYKLKAEEYAKIFIPEEKRNVVKETIQSAIKTNDPSNIIELEHPIINGDGTRGFINVKCKRDVDGTGKVIRLYGVNQEITNRILYERELVHAKEEAEKSDKLKSEFLAQMSHEIRTPINTILSFTSLLKNEIIEYCDKDLVESFSIIDGAGRRLIRTIDLILNMSQIQTNTYEAYPKKFNLYNTVARDLLAEYSQLAEVKRIRFNVINNSENPFIYADEYTIIQIFDNLLNNAFKYTSEGKVELRLSNESDRTLIVQVADTGVGISEEFIPNLFNPFVQEEGGYTRKYEGNGLGLALVKKYCDLNDARIMVSSSKGKGTVFTVKFKT